MQELNFHFEDREIELPNEQKLEQWLAETAKAEGKHIGELNYIFCSDEYLYEMNVQYLQHDTYTDVITFPYEQEDEPTRIDGDIFISTDRVADNAREFDLTFHEELLRVVVHGLLHLLGYEDGTKEEKNQMRNKEDFYLRAWEGLEA